jgi:tetratricopeptide (TPR) repeat protein
LQLATLLLEGGSRDEAMRAFGSFIDVYRTHRSRLTAGELRVVAVACRYLGRDNPQLYKDALRVYDEAIARDSTNLDTRTELGLLFLEKYNGTDARAMLEGVLAANPRHPRALLGMARVTAFGGRGDASPLVRQALDVNPAIPSSGPRRRSCSSTSSATMRRPEPFGNLAADTGERRRSRRSQQHGFSPATRELRAGAAARARRSPARPTPR